MGRWKNPEKKKPSKHFWCAISHIRGKETPWEIVPKFCVLVDIWDVITFVTFDDDRLRGLGMARGRISHFPIILRRCPYNTLALPCECWYDNTIVWTPYTLLCLHVLYMFLALEAYLFHAVLFCFSWAYILLWWVPVNSYPFQLVPCQVVPNTKSYPKQLVPTANSYPNHPI